MLTERRNLSTDQRQPINRTYRPRSFNQSNQLMVKLLVVDDEPAIRDAFSTLLRLEGYEVHTAVDGRDALTLLATGFRPSLIILDLMMPHINGWEFRRAQLADPSIAAIPVVIVTGATERPMDPALLSTAGVLRKPIDADAVLGIVGRIALGR